MLFLIDENLPVSLSEIFTNRGYSAECVREIKQLQGKPGEVVFDYAVKQRAIIVTRDLGFGNPLRSDLPKLAGIRIIRFLNDISMKALKTEIARLIEDFEEDNFQQLFIIEPGSVRTRKI